MTSGIDIIPKAIADKLRAESFDTDDALVQTAYLAACDLEIDFIRRAIDLSLWVAKERDGALAQWTMIILRRVPTFQRQ